MSATICYLLSTPTPNGYVPVLMTHHKAEAECQRVFGQIITAHSVKEAGRFFHAGCLEEVQ